MAIDDFNTDVSRGAGTQAVVGLFTDGEDARQALSDLRAAGLRSSQIGAAFRDASSASYGSDAYDSEVRGRDESGSDVTGRDAYRNDALETPTALDEPSTGYGPVGNDPRTETGDYASTMGRSHVSKAESYGHAAGAKAEGWWEKVKHFFGDDDDDATRTERDTAAYGSSTTGAVATGTGVGEYTTGRTAAGGYGTASDYEYDYNDADFSGSLAAVGLPQERARALAQELGPGGAIVTVNAPGREQEAEDILERNNGRIRHENLSGTPTGAGSTGAGSTALGTAAAAGAGVTDYAAAQREPFAERERTGLESRSGVESPADDYASTSGERDYAAAGATTTGDYAGRGTGTDRVQLFGEVLRVHKERIDRGEVVVRKQVVSENQNIQVPVTREEFVIDRVPVQGERPAPGARLGEGQNQEIRVPLSEERVTVEKQPVVREEVVVGKREITDNEQVGDQVRHEELRVDDSAGKGVSRETGTREGRVDDPTVRRPA